MRFCLGLLAALAWAGGIEGGARLADGRVAVWGDGFHVSEKSVARGEFARGGCVADWNGDGLPDLIVQRRSAELNDMVAFVAPAWVEERIDGGADFRDCLGAELFGRRGVLVTHRQAQVRFYERGRGYREIYSIYTASAQSGLKLHDVDGDSRVDILHGSYWLRAPERFELGWRLFALQTWFDTARGSMVRIAVVGLGGRDVVVEAESEASPARFAWFERLSDAEQLWLERKIEVAGGLRQPQCLSALDEGWVVAGEDAGAGSRLIAIDIRGGTQRVVARSEGFLEVWPDVGGRLTALTREGVRHYRWRR